MFISRNWLSDYVDIADQSDEEISRILTDLGLEIEGTTKIAPLHEKLVVGKVLEASAHPNADSLKLCSVDVGEDAPLSIVCGAPNAREGIKVCVAQIGAVLPGDFKIKPTKIRGEKSQGMMCSGKELEISNDREGIIELGEDAEVGSLVSKLYPTGDTVFELNVTPNRGDCLGYIGVARELAAKLERALILPNADTTEMLSDKNVVDHVSVKVEDTDLSSRFTASYVEGVTICESPLWMQKRLEATGMRPVNLVVDVTNYVMLEYSQPIHAYDERDLADNRLAVRRGKDGDTLKTLDGSEVDIQPSDILICDGSDKPVGLAGIMGGENSEVKEDTSNIVVEVAEFNPTKIRLTSKRLSLHTEASHRFERSVDASNIAAVSSRVARLLYDCSKELDIKLPSVAKGLCDSAEALPSPSRIALRSDRAQAVLGIRTLTKDLCKNMLSRLGFTTVDEKAERILVEVPSHRHDITREIDLIEEIGRLYGFDLVPYELPRMNIKPNTESPYIDFCEKLKIGLASLGLTEVILYPFVSKKDYEKALIQKGHPFYPTVELENPLSEEYGTLQTTPCIPGLHAILKNRHTSQKGSRLFQLTRGYFNQKDLAAEGIFKDLARTSLHMTEKAATETDRFVERHFLTMVFDSPYTSQNWDQKKKSADFFDVKRVCERIFAMLSLRGVTYKKVSQEELPHLHPGLSATLWKEDTYLGYVGGLHPSASKALGFGTNEVPYVADLEIETIFKETLKEKSVNTTSYSFPAATRDISFLARKETTHADFERALSTFNRRKHIVSMNLFDVYEGENVDSGHKAMAYSFELRSLKQTLKDSQVDKELTAFISHVESELGATQR